MTVKNAVIWIIGVIICKAHNISATLIYKTIQEKYQILSVYIIYVKIKTMGSESIWTNEDILLNA